MIEMKGEEIREDIAGIINFVKEDTKSISFTTDAWTSLSGDPFLSLTIQLIDCDWNLLCFTPFVRPFPGNHSGVNIAVCLDGMIEELGIDSTAWELFSVNDNASNMKLGIKLSKYLNEYNCDIHTLELAVKDSFKNTVGMNDALKSAKSLAQFVNKSPLAQSNLKDECLKQNIHYKKIVNPPNTRWSGYQSTLASVCALKIPLINLMHSDNSSWSEHIIHSDQWKLMEGAVQLLKPIR